LVLDRGRTKVRTEFPRVVSCGQYDFWSRGFSGGQHVLQLLNEPPVYRLVPIHDYRRARMDRGLDHFSLLQLLLVDFKNIDEVVVFAGDGLGRRLLLCLQGFNDLGYDWLFTNPCLGGRPGIVRCCLFNHGSDCAYLSQLNGLALGNLFGLIAFDPRLGRYAY
jgi:hypothetical protein